MADGTKIKLESSVHVFRRESGFRVRRTYTPKDGVQWELLGTLAGDIPAQKNYADELESAFQWGIKA